MCYFGLVFSLKSNKNKFTLGDIYKNLTQQLKLASCWSIAEEESPDLKNCKINGNCKFIKSY